MPVQSEIFRNLAGKILNFLNLAGRILNFQKYFWNLVGKIWKIPKLAGKILNFLNLGIKILNFANLTWQQDLEFCKSYRYFFGTSSNCKLEFMQTDKLHYNSAKPLPEICPQKKFWLEFPQLFSPFKGLFTWRWGTPDRWGNMCRVTPPIR